MGQRRSCIVTMSKNDYTHCHRWFKYYSNFFAQKDIYFIDNNSDSDFLDNLPAGISLIHVPDRFRTDRNLNQNYHLQDNFDGSRALFVSEFTNGLLNYYDIVIYTDIDEFIVPDRRNFVDLGDFLENMDLEKLICPVGLNVVHIPHLEPLPIDDGKAITDQRRFVEVNLNYAKPILKIRPYQWSGGFHGCNSEFSIDQNLYLFHTRDCDYEQRLRVHLDRHIEYEKYGKGERSSWRHSSDRLVNIIRHQIEASVFHDSESELRSQCDDILVRRNARGYFFAGRGSQIADQRTLSHFFFIPDRFKGIF